MIINHDFFFQGAFLTDFSIGVLSLVILFKKYLKEMLKIDV